MMGSIGFKLEKINTEQFAIIESSYDEGNENFELEANLKFGINSESHSIISIIKFQFEQEKNPFIIIEASCEFEIDPEKWKKFSNNKIITIPKGFMAHLAMITVGTTRGILHAKTENSRFNEFLLPTINVSEMINEDGKFQE